MPDYTFRPLTLDDKALFMGWLAAPHIGGWWGSPDSQWAHVVNHWAETPQQTAMHIAQVDGTDFGYAQSYDVQAYGSPHYADRGTGAQALDFFLGEAAYLGQGHGTGMIRTRAHQLIFAGAPAVLVDPDVLNTHAIGSYERAGFNAVEERICNDGNTVLVMEFTGPSA
jgi:aminoglycoside 6'-N-acetyltransferase